MNEYTLTILLHPSIETTNSVLTGKIKDNTRILDGIIAVLRNDKTIAELLIFNNDIKPGYLLISDKRELKTTGIINEIIESDLNVRIIPISHGG